MSRPVRISGLATYVPPRVLTNEDLEHLVDTTDAWILQRTGIRERHLVDPGQATSDLAEPAPGRSLKVRVQRARSWMRNSPSTHSSTASGYRRNPPQ